MKEQAGVCVDGFVDETADVLVCAEKLENELYWQEL